MKGLYTIIISLVAMLCCSGCFEAEPGVMNAQLVEGMELGKYQQNHLNIHKAEQKAYVRAQTNNIDHRLDQNLAELTKKADANGRVDAKIAADFIKKIYTEDAKNREDIRNNVATWNTKLENNELSLQAALKIHAKTSEYLAAGVDESAVGSTIDAIKDVAAPEMGGK